MLGADRGVTLRARHQHCRALHCAYAAYHNHSSIVPTTAAGGYRCNKGAMLEADQGLTLRARHKHCQDIQKPWAVATLDSHMRSRPIIQVTPGSILTGNLSVTWILSYCVITLLGLNPAACRCGRVGSGAEQHSDAHEASKLKEPTQRTLQSCCRQAMNTSVQNNCIQHLMLLFKGYAQHASSAGAMLQADRGLTLRARHQQCRSLHCAYAASSQQQYCAQYCQWLVPMMTWCNDGGRPRPDAQGPPPALMQSLALCICIIITTAILCTVLRTAVPMQQGCNAGSRPRRDAQGLPPALMQSLALCICSIITTAILCTVLPITVPMQQGWNAGGRPRPDAQGVPPALMQSLALCICSITTTA